MKDLNPILGITKIDYINDIVSIEIESTSNCNAKCPGCFRTNNPDLYDINYISILDFKRIFPSKEFIENKRFQFFGVLGDHLLNPDCYEITKYLIDNDGSVRISTNGGYGSKNLWDKLGILSETSNRLLLTFSVDGYSSSNHLYRIGTNFDTILRNMEIYSNIGNRKVLGEWVYLLFDHNIHDIEKAANKSLELGLDFKIKYSLRNIATDWNVLIKNIPEKLRPVNIKYDQEQYIDLELSKFNLELKEKINSKNYPSNIDTKLYDTISCRYYDEKRLFVAYNKTLWPCCFLWDSYLSRTKKNSTMPIDYFDHYQNGFNSLEKYSIQEILDHIWFSKDLKDSWFPNYTKHTKKCLKSCANNQSFRDKTVNYTNG